MMGKRFLREKALSLGPLVPALALVTSLATQSPSLAQASQSDVVNATHHSAPPPPAHHTHHQVVTGGINIEPVIAYNSTGTGTLNSVYNNSVFPWLGDAGYILTDSNSADGMVGINVPAVGSAMSVVNVNESDWFVWPNGTGNTNGSTPFVGTGNGVGFTSVVQTSPDGFYHVSHDYGSGANFNSFPNNAGQPSTDWWGQSWTLIDNYLPATTAPVTITRMAFIYYGNANSTSLAFFNRPIQFLDPSGTVIKNNWNLLPTANTVFNFEPGS